MPVRLVEVTPIMYTMDIFHKWLSDRYEYNGLRKHHTTQIALINDNPKQAHQAHLEVRYHNWLHSWCFLV